MKNIRISEPARIADQLRRAFDGSAWHGPALLELLEDVDAATAAARPLRGVHSIWELVLHIQAWDGAAHRRIGGNKAQPKGRDNFPVVPRPTQANWKQAMSGMAFVHEVLVDAVQNLPDSRLWERVPGKRYNFYHLLHGIVQHELYHAGQIALLKKAQGKT